MLFPSITESTWKAALPPTLNTLAHCFPYHETHPGLPFSLGRGTQHQHTASHNTDVRIGKMRDKRREPFGCDRHVIINNRNQIARRSPSALSTGGTCRLSGGHVEQCLRPHVALPQLLRSLLGPFVTSPSNDDDLLR